MTEKLLKVSSPDGTEKYLQQNSNINLPKNNLLRNCASLKIYFFVNERWGGGGGGGREGGGASYKEADVALDGFALSPLGEI